MSHSSIEPDKVVQDLSEHPYYKGLRKSLKEKADNNTKKLEESSRMKITLKECYPNTSDGVSTLIIRAYVNH